MKLVNNSKMGIQYTWIYTACIGEMCAISNEFEN